MGHRVSFLIASLTALAACGAPEAAHAPAAPAAVPDVALATMSGGRAPLAQITGGRVALVSMWATWCDGCIRELEALNRLDAKTAAGGDAVVVGVDVGEEPGKVAAFAQEHGLRYVLLADPDFAFANAVGQPRVPATLVVDRQGRIVFRGDALDARSLEALRQAIAAKP